MKFKAKSTNTAKLYFNDLGSVIKGVSPDALPMAITLDAGESIYLPNSSGVLYSVAFGDAKRFAAAGLLEIDDVVAAAGVLTVAHNFGRVPTLTVAKKSGSTWVDAIAGTDYTTVTNAARTETVITNAAAVDILVNIG